LIAHVSAIFLLPVFEKSVIINNFQSVAHSISAREGGNTVCWTGMASPLDLLSSRKLPQPKHRLGPSGLAICLFRCLCTKTQPKCGLASVANAPDPNFCPYDVRTRSRTCCACLRPRRV